MSMLRKKVGSGSLGTWRKRRISGARTAQPSRRSRRSAHHPLWGLWIDVTVRYLTLAHVCVGRGGAQGHADRPPARGRTDRPTDRRPPPGRPRAAALASAVPSPGDGGVHIAAAALSEVSCT